MTSFFFYDKIVYERVIILNKIYVIGIHNEAVPVLKKVKELNDKIVTVLVDEYNDNNVDIFIKYDFGFNDFKGRGYKGIATDLLDSIKDDVEELYNRIDENDELIIFNNLFNTGSLEMFYYLCDKIGHKVNNCYVLVCNGYNFLGRARKEYNNEILKKIYNLNYQIYELDGDEVSKIKNAKDITQKIDCVYDEFYNYIKSILGKVSEKYEK